MHEIHQKVCRGNVRVRACACGVCMRGLARAIMCMLCTCVYGHTMHARVLEYHKMATPQIVTQTNMCHLCKKKKGG